MSDLGESMIKGMQEALDFAEGKGTGAVARIPGRLDAGGPLADKVMRTVLKLHLSLANLAKLR